MHGTSNDSSMCIFSITNGGFSIDRDTKKAPSIALAVMSRYRELIPIVLSAKINVHKGGHKYVSP